MGGLDWKDFLQSLAGASCCLLFVLGIIGSVIYLVRRKRPDTAAPGEKQTFDTATPESVQPAAALPDTPTTRPCSSCGAVNPSENNFCERCGAPLT